ncbi:hypothetical protein [Pseudohaliea rubra]|uniref:Uncharacterized protein n=1 Tax=Pseudohaliea rubra DSM 19751 TaxID=1265313 RepID=A0A095VQT4_9GAMM|nr:hypothetical protein [Pseudohaliea rubra]KGE03822.1 hypothetical protein HRUBRA_01569 [Pseudohaliea rubra DSM 19751]
MLDTIIAVLIEKGLDGKAKSSESALLRDTLRERSAREVRLNLALWKLPASKPRPHAFAAMVSSDAFDAVCTLNLPLRSILDVNELAAEAKDLLEAGPEGERLDTRFKQWAAGITNEVILVERIWHRLRVLQCRQDLDGSLGNLDHLMHLHRALEMRLTSHPATQ